MKPKTDYKSFVQTAKSLANKGEAYHLQLMRLLVEVEQQKIVWYGHPHKSWAEVLNEERLCTMSAFTSFKKAIQLNINVDALGVAASCLLAKQTGQVRLIVLRNTTDWVKTHRIPPRYQLVSELVKATLLKQGKKPVNTYTKLKSENVRLERENAKLTAYVEALQATLRRHKITIPKS
jgi:hypothetical protein